MIYFEIIFYLIYFDGIKLISNSIIRGEGGGTVYHALLFCKNLIHHVVECSV